MSYSRRQLYALGEPIGDSATYKEGGRTIYGSGGGGGGQQTSTGTTYNTNIPEYAEPYVQTMLGSAQKQIYTMDDSGQATGFKPYTPYSTDVNQYFAGPAPMQEQAYKTAANLEVPNQYAAASGLVGRAAGAGLGAGATATGLQGEALGYGAAGAGYGATGAGYGAVGAEQAARAASEANLRAARFGEQAGLYGGAAAGAATRGFGAGAEYARMATDPTAIKGYMSPYMQNVVDYQKMQAARDYGIAATQRRAQAVGAGAFGGSRQAIQEAEAERSLMSQLQGITATGSQQAFQNAQQAQQFGANLGLQGLQAGTGALQTGISGAQAGLQGVGQQLAAGQLGLAGTAQGIQGAQAGMQGAGVGLSGVGAATQAGQYGLSGAQAATQAAQTLGQLGTSDLAAQTQIANLQSTYGAQQQALEQQKINQAIQNYATQQQYPYMQLGIMNSLLRGLPMQATTVESYQATPSIGQQAAGLGLTGLGAYKTLSSFKEGGEVKGYANRGLAAASGVENSIRAKLEMMTPQQLEQIAKTSQSPEIRAMAEEVLAEHTQRDRAEDRARQAIAQEQAAKPQIPQEAPAGLAAAPTPNLDTVSAAGGGIVAFAGRDESLVQDEEEGYNPFANIQDKQLREVALGQEQLRRSFGYKDGVYDQYKQFLAEKQAGLGKEREGAIGAWLMDLGSRVSSTAGPAGQVMGQSIQGSLPTLQKGLVDYKKGQADLYKAQADVAKAENDVALGRADKTQAAYDALRREENDFKRTQMQVEGQIRAAGISASRSTDLKDLTGSFLQDRLAKGEPDNPATRAAAARDAVTALRGDPTAKLDATISKNAQDAVDKSIQSGSLGLINLDLHQANKKLEKNPDDVALKRKVEDLQRKYKAEEARIRQGAVSTTTAAAPTATPAPVPPAPVGAVTVDGYVFPTQEQADAYKRAKAGQKPA